MVLLTINILLYGAHPLPDDIAVLLQGANVAFDGFGQFTGTVNNIVFQSSKGHLQVVQFQGDLD
jgi:hypothetical protein